MLLAMFSLWYSSVVDLVQCHTREKDNRRPRMSPVQCCEEEFHFHKHSKGSAIRGVRIVPRASVFPVQNGPKSGHVGQSLTGCLVGLCHSLTPVSS